MIFSILNKKMRLKKNEREYVKKILFVILLFVGVGYAQEENGVFIGFEIGVGEDQLTLNSLLVAGVEAKLTGVSGIYGGKVGYKHFINSWFGLRGYGNLSYSGFKSITEINDGNTVVNNITKSDVFVYSANIDALFNFYNAESSSIGAFIGIGLGGQSIEYAEPGLTGSATGFYGDAKLGLRATTLNHGMEFIVKIPFTEVKKDFITSGIKATAKSNYQILLGYNYNF